jgi:hypothetical protein
VDGGWASRACHEWVQACSGGNGSADAKKTRVEGSPEQDAVSAAVNAEVGATTKPEDSAPATERKGAGDIFLANGIRERLGRELDVSKPALGSR